ncbi:NAD(P)/FAD-dependent oxidoreductase [Nocardia cyriacigeorgica]|uniref:NAD(P)/FAD-dependent oxidoreductase n=1 Tax=Nocardia cyriacigeorgica TaxID=135487 RepID=UPI001895E751|nr:FAD/NAD(P)-binding oxidoreductase [Nocardia cyriacigeorgica]MBF6512807.1 NAD(P)/FAD-dependent oxidoreductase [Nocardia cyriacigeorgica]
MTAAPIVIVGAGLAGLRTAEELRRAGYEGELILLGDESRPPYDRPPLSKQFVRGETDDTTLRPAEFFTEKKIDLRLNQEAVGVDAEARRVRLADGSVLDYSELIIATGLRPRKLPGLPDLDGVHVLRDHADASALRAELGDATTALVVGAGFIGCEVAASLRARGLQVVLVEPQPTPLASVLGEQVGALVARMHRDEGVDLRCGIGVDSLLADDAGRVRGALLTDGTEVAAELVVIGVGSLPVTEWLSDSGIELADPSAGGGVLADEVGRTSAPGVWAVGDVAAWLHDDGARTRVEHWTNAGEQAKLLACALLGAESPTAARVPYFWSDQYDVKIQALGTPRPADEIHIVADDGRKFLVYYTEDGTLTGVVGAGMTAQVMKTRAKIAAGAPVAELLGAG